MAAPMQAEFTAGELRLESPQARLTAIRAWCRLASTGLHVSTVWRAGPLGFLTDCGPIQVNLRLEDQDGHLSLVLAAMRSGPPEDVLEIGLETQPEIVGMAPSWIQYEGYQSWDPAGVRPLGASPVTSWWTCGLSTDGGATLAFWPLGQLWNPLRIDSRREATSVAFTASLPDAEPKPIWPASGAEHWIGTPLQIAFGADARQAMRMAISVGVPRARRKPTPLGWLSWYQFGPWVDADVVGSHSALLAKEPWRDLGYSLVQVDDGWQMAYGDWIPNAKFQPDLKPVATPVTDRGQTLGIWTAPFLVSLSSDLAETAPEDWFLHGPDGARLLDPRHTMLGPMQILDLGHPAVVAHLAATFRRLRAAGVGYFKLDFLYAGAQSGLRELRSALMEIRRAVGDAYILASGAPLPAVKGLVDGCRIGQDVATPGYDFEAGRPEVRLFGDEILWVARNAAARHRLDAWFDLDPDVVLVGDAVSLEQSRQLASLAALCGGPFVVGDDMCSLAPDRLALLTNPEILALVGGAPAVPDWEPSLQDLPPTVWRRMHETTLVLGVFNWSAQPMRRVVSIDGGPWQVRDLWNRTDLGRTEGALELVVPGHSVCVLRLNPA